MYHTEIRIKGKLNPDWSDWFEGMIVHHRISGDTILCGSLPDISAVYGVLSRLSCLGITLISVVCEEEPRPCPPE
ncbi:MAG TPA: hypothetical protein PJ988_07385 [Anaerolinea sp.]|nr:hypothetical protein [Anaerolinea sp.]